MENISRTNQCREADYSQFDTAGHVLAHTGDIWRAKCQAGGSLQSGAVPGGGGEGGYLQNQRHSD